MEKREVSYKWILVGLLWLVALLNYLDRQMLSTMRPAMQIDIKELESATYFGYLMSIFLWIYGLMSPVAGMIADRINKKWLIITSLFIWSAVTLAMGFATTFNQLYFLRAVMGMSEAFYIPAGLALIADYHTDRSRSLAIGIHMSGIYLGQAFGGFGATIAERWNWQTCFSFFGIVGLIYSFVLILFLRSTKTNTVVQNKLKVEWSGFNFLNGFKTLLTNPAFWIILLYFTIPSLPGWVVKNWLPTLMSNNLGLKMSVAGPLTTITIAGASLLGVLLGGIAADKWILKNIKGRIYTSAFGLALTIPSLLLLGFGNSLVTMIGSAFCFGLGFGIFDCNNMPILCQFVSPAHRATGYGLLNLAGISAGAVMTNIMGKSIDKGNTASNFIFFAIIVSLVICIQLFFLKPRSNDFVES